MKTETKKQERERVKLAAVDRLREMIKPGDTIGCVLRHVSRSGMSRCITLLHNGESIDYLAARACGWKICQSHGGIRIGGCGMDMGFALVTDLAYYLTPDGFDCVGEGCPSNDHSNGDRNYQPHRHASGFYSLRHRWI